MKIAITGGTGCIGSAVAQELTHSGHEVVLVQRGIRAEPPSITSLPHLEIRHASMTDRASLEHAFLGCDAVAHCAGINRNLGAQTYRAVHIEGTQHVVAACRNAVVKKIVYVSFLRARPACRSAYHESKPAAEEIVRTSGLDYTILKPGVVYGTGDHMLNHLSRALYTFPIFPFVGMTDRPVRPVAVADLARIIGSYATEHVLSRETVAVLGPTELGLSDAVRMVARTTGRSPLFFRAPIALHWMLAWWVERLMVTPLVSLAQVRILQEGIVEPIGLTAALPNTLIPMTPFTEASIRAGLPPPGPFGIRDLRVCGALRDRAAS